MRRRHETVTNFDRGEEMKTNRKILIRARKHTQIHMSRREETTTDNDREEEVGVN